MKKGRDEYELPSRRLTNDSDQTDLRNHGLESRRSADRQQAKRDQAALIFGNSVNRPEVEIMKEVVPGLDLMVIMEILNGNGFDLERSIDSALALMTSLAAEDGKAVLSDSYSLPKDVKIPSKISTAAPSSNRGINKEDFLSSVQQRPSSSSSSRHSINSRTPEQQKIALRGVPMILSKKFLAAPRYRLVINKETNEKTEFTIFFRRKSEKLGITIQEQDSEIRIHTLHMKAPNEPLLAKESGIKIGDILTGINSEFFSPGAEVQDIIDILHLAGTFVALHFTRRHVPMDLTLQSHPTLNHKFAYMLMDQRVISKERAGMVSKALHRLKERSLSWDSFSIAQKIENWKLDTCLNQSGWRNRNTNSHSSTNSHTNTNMNTNTNTNTTNYSVVSPDRSPLPFDRNNNNNGNNDSNDRSSSGNNNNNNNDNNVNNNSNNNDNNNNSSYDNSSNNSNNCNSNNNSNNNTNSNTNNNANSNGHNSKSSKDIRNIASIPPSRHVRPAISVRIIRAEERSDHVVYVIWVMDIRSGAEWFVRRRFREFHEFRDVLVTFRAGIGRLDFPSKRLNVAEIGAMIPERIQVLQKFLRKVCSLVCINSLHPSTIRIQLLLQQFLEVTDRMENILYLEMKPSYQRDKYMVQVFVHSIMQMGVMDKVMSGYIESFFESTSIEDNKKWTESEGRKVLNGMKDFVDNLEVVLYEAIADDCADIMRKYSGPIPGSVRSSKRASEDLLGSLINAATSAISSEPKPQIPDEDYGFRRRDGSMSSLSDTNNFIDIDAASGMGMGLGVSEDGEELKEHSPSEFGCGARTLDPDSVKSFEDCNAVRTLQNGHEVVSEVVIEVEADTKMVAEREAENDKMKEREMEREKELREIIERCHDDEMRMKIRSAVRRQVEIEVVVPCASRLRIILNKSFSSTEAALRKNVLKILNQPQSFFGIPVKQISESNWSVVVELMRDIRSKTLPHDRLEALLLTAKEIPIHFVREHPASLANNVTLGADDFLPIFIYIIAKANVTDIYAMSEELQALCDPDKRMSETGYYVATLEASLQHIIEANVTSESQALFPDTRGEMVDSDDGSSDDEDDDDDENNFYSAKSSPDKNEILNRKR